MGDRQLAIVKAGQVEVIVNRSRFIGLALPLVGLAVAEEVQRESRRNYPDALHHVVAWRAGAGHERAMDDGEPQGTAGPPLLQTLRRANVAFGALVVVRYYGGRKLGRPGLYRAYLSAARQALAKAELMQQVWGTNYQVTLPPAAERAFVRSVEASGGRILSTGWGARVQMQYWLPDADGLQPALNAPWPDAKQALPLGREQRGVRATD